MQIPPIEVLLSFPPPDFINPQRRGPGLLIFNVILFPLVILAVALRVYSRSRLSKSFGRDDVFLVLAVIPTTAMAVLGLISTYKYALDRHVYDLEFDMAALGWKYALITEILFSLAAAFTKLSMLFLTWRLTYEGSGGLRKLTGFFIGETIVGGIIFITISIFQCTPVSDFWTLSFGPQRCINHDAYLMAWGVLNTVTDFVVVLLPIPSVWKLNVPRRQQIMVLILFGAGFLVCLAGITRAFFQYRMALRDDASWDSYPVWIASSFELYLGIMCTSIPGTKPFFSRYLPKLFPNSTTFSISKRSQVQSENISRYNTASISGSSNLKFGPRNSFADFDAADDFAIPFDDLPPQFHPPVSTLPLSPPPAYHSPTSQNFPGRKSSARPDSVTLGDGFRISPTQGSSCSENKNIAMKNRQRKGSLRSSVSSFADYYPGGYPTRALTPVNSDGEGEDPEDDDDSVAGLDGAEHPPSVRSERGSTAGIRSRKGSVNMLGINLGDKQGSSQEALINVGINSQLVADIPSMSEQVEQLETENLDTEQLEPDLDTDLTAEDETTFGIQMSNPRPASGCTVGTFGHGRGKSSRDEDHRGDKIITRDGEAERPRPKQLLDVYRM